MDEGGMWRAKGRECIFESGHSASGSDWGRGEGDFNGARMDKDVTKNEKKAIRKECKDVRDSEKAVQARR
jgi:hypothetical protein